LFFLVLEVKLMFHLGVVVLVSRVPLQTDCLTIGSFFGKVFDRHFVFLGFLRVFRGRIQRVSDIQILLLEQLHHHFVLLCFNSVRNLLHVVLHVLKPDLLVCRLNRRLFLHRLLEFEAEVSACDQFLQASS
jgi:hypothetical protein